MKTTKLKILIASALLFLTASAQALQPELLYAFQLGPKNPAASLVQGSDGHFYGTSSSGGSSDAGTVFQVTTNGVMTTVVAFKRTIGASPSTNSAYPQAKLVLGSDGHFYGTTRGGGSSDRGTVFKVSTNGVLTTLVSFTGTNGADPQAGLVLGRDGNFYGTTAYGGGGTSGYGTVFKVTTNGVLTTLVSFTGEGAEPRAGVVLGRDGNFYGTTFGGGSGGGTVYKVTPNGVLTMLVSFKGTNGENPQAELVLGLDGHFYGTTGRGGSTDAGTVFKMTTNGLLTSLVSFNTTNGAFPWASLVLGNDGNFYGTTKYGGAGGSYGTVFKVTSNGVLTTLVSFNNDNGAIPCARLVLGSDGNFYGTTTETGTSSYGTVFKVTTNGVLTTLVEFADPNGASPNELVLGSDGNFYGTTSGGGSGYGTVFEVTTNGVLTSLVSFSGNNGARPMAGLVLGTDGNFYGTTEYGGSGASGPFTGSGTVFKVTTNGVLTSLVSFDYDDGAYPRARLVLGSDGDFYGTTLGGGSSGRGTVFKLTTNGVLTSLAPLNDTNGAYPHAGLVLGSDGNFYGTTAYNNPGLGWRGEGTVFQVTTNGVLTTLARFNGTNGALSRAQLVLGRDGNFYGTTSQGGSSYVNPDNAAYGTVFRVTTNGVLTSLVSFTDDNGANPHAGLVLGNDGYFYGTTSAGGPGGGGTIFRLVVSAFTSVARQPGGSVLLTGTGPANGAYRLWASTDLSLPFASWTLLTSASFDSNGNFSYTDASAATNPSRFYQLSIP